MKRKKIVYATQGHIKELLPFVDKVLDAIYEVCGCRVAFASDESCMSDFQIKQKDLKKFKDILGVNVGLNDCVWRVAERLKKKDA